MELIKTLIFGTFILITNIALADTKNTYAILPDGAKIVAGAHKNEFYILGKGETLPVQNVSIAKKSNLSTKHVTLQASTKNLSKQNSLTVGLNKSHQTKINIKKLADKKMIAKLNEALKEKKISTYFRELSNKKMLTKLHNALRQKDKKTINADIKKLVDKKNIEKLRHAIEHEIASQQHISRKKMA